MKTSGAICGIFGLIIIVIIVFALGNTIYTIADSRSYDWVWNDSIGVGSANHTILEKGKTMIFKVETSSGYHEEITSINVYVNQVNSTPIFNKNYTKELSSSISKSDKPTSDSEIVTVTIPYDLSDGSSVDNLVFSVDYIEPHYEAEGYTTQTSNEIVKLKIKN